MKVLLTGAFGNIGLSAIEELVRQGDKVRCFDLKNKRNEKIFKRLKKEYGERIEVFLGRYYKGRRYRRSP